MKNSLEVLLSPADFTLLPGRDLTNTTCVVFDVLRATSTIVTALANGARGIAPVAEIPEALRLREKYPDILLAGERNGLRIEAAVSGGVDFDLGNSPREFTSEKVAGRTIAMATTNGTRALRACAGAREVLVGSFLNMEATIKYVKKAPPENLLLICSGTFEDAAYEDLLASGALAHYVWRTYMQGEISDSAFAVRILFAQDRGTLINAISRSRNGRRLLTIPELRDDVEYCAQMDIFNLVAKLDADGFIRAVATKPVRGSAGNLLPSLV